MIDLQLTETPDGRKLDNRLSERPVFLSTEQFQTVNLSRRLNKVFEQRLKVVLSWGSFKRHWTVSKAGSPSRVAGLHGITLECWNKVLVRNLVRRTSGVKGRK